MATSVNNITGDLMRSRGANDAYRDGHERIFGKAPEVPQTEFKVGETCMAKSVTVCAVMCIAHERGWGSSVDGFLLFETGQHVDDFIKDKSAQSNKDLDYWVEYVYHGEVIVSEYFASTMKPPHFIASLKQVLR